MTEPVPTTIRFLGLAFDPSDAEKAAGLEGKAIYEMRADHGDRVWDSWKVGQPFNRTGKGTAPGGNPVWKWDGNLDEPTLTPSFVYGELASDGWRVHLFLTAGAIAPCGDQTAEVLA